MSNDTITVNLYCSKTNLPGKPKNILKIPTNELINNVNGFNGDISLLNTELLKYFDNSSYYGSWERCSIKNLENIIIYYVYTIERDITKTEITNKLQLLTLLKEKPNAQIDVNITYEQPSSTPIRPVTQSSAPIRPVTSSKAQGKSVTPIRPVAPSEVAPVASEVASEVAQYKAIPVAPEVAPVAPSEVAPIRPVTPSVGPEVASEVAPSVASEVAPKVATEVAPPKTTLSQNQLYQICLNLLKRTSLTNTLSQKLFESIAKKNPTTDATTTSTVNDDFNQINEKIKTLFATICSLAGVTANCDLSVNEDIEKVMATYSTTGSAPNDDTSIIIMSIIQMLGLGLGTALLAGGKKKKTKGKKYSSRKSNKKTKRVNRKRN